MMLVRHGMSRSAVIKILLGIGLKFSSGPLGYNHNFSLTPNTKQGSYRCNLDYKGFLTSLKYTFDPKLRSFSEPITSCVNQNLTLELSN